MPKATEHSTTSRRALFSAAAVLPLAAMPVMTMAAEPGGDIHAIGRRIRALSDRLDEIENRRLPLDEAERERTMKADQVASGALWSDIYELQDEAIRVPAQTLGDAAVQAGIAMSLAETIGVCELTSADREEYVQKIIRAQASIMLVLCRVARLDMERLGLNDLDWFCNREFPNAIVGRA